MYFIGKRQWSVTLVMMTVRLQSVCQRLRQQLHPCHRLHQFSQCHLHQHYHHRHYHHNHRQTPYQHSQHHQWHQCQCLSQCHVHHHHCEFYHCHCQIQCIYFISTSVTITVSSFTFSPTITAAVTKKGIDRYVFVFRCGILSIAITEVKNNKI